MAQQQVTDPAPWMATIPDSSRHAIITTDLDGMITSWNSGAEQLFGYAAAEVLGHSIRILIPAGREGEEDLLVGRLRQGDPIEAFETLRRRKDGKLTPVSLSLSAVSSARGDIVAITRIARDLRARRRLEPDLLLLAAIVESSEDAIVSKDLNGIVLTWNRAAERIFGYAAEEIVGKPIRTIVPDERQGEEDEVIARVRSGDRVDYFETVRRRKDGTLIPVSLTVSPVRDEHGNVVGASRIARDISERKQAESERARLLAIAQEAGRLKDEFLANLSHELRTPLNAILGYSRMIRTGLVTGEKEERAIETIERNATSLTQIIEDVLDVSRIISGKIRLHVRPLELPTLVREALDTVGPAVDAKEIRIEAILLDPGDAPISGDPDRLQQVLWNLMSNAVKFTPEGGRIQVRLERVDSHVELIVSDTGEGIAPEFLPHVFERFRQADAGMTRVHGGLGLGLAITRQLVEMHGGTIHVSSAGRGAGATFCVKLPLMIARVQESAEERVHPRAARSGVDAQVPSLAGVSVLAVDDDVDALILMREILEAAGARVVTADSAAEALRVLELNQPDALLADVGMPHMSGFELIDRIRRSANPRVKSLPAAALTAYARSEDRTRALRSGFQLHLAKPIDPSELMAAIAALAKRSVN